MTTGVHCGSEPSNGVKVEGTGPNGDEGVESSVPMGVPFPVALPSMSLWMSPEFQRLLSAENEEEDEQTETRTGSE